MKNLKNIVWALVTWTVVLYCSYQMTLGATPFANVVLFYVWLFFVTACLSVSPEHRAKTYESGRTLPHFVVALPRAATLFALVYSGHFLTAAAYVFAIAAYEVAHSNPAVAEKGETQ